MKRERGASLPAAKGKNSARKLDPNVSQLEQTLAEKLGAQVAIRHGVTGGGSLTIRYSSLDELDGILAHIH